ncbi:hypothetical protein ABZ464_34505 [Streptomyces sp. NPDC005820]|uniref:CBU_0592 family membrane protein n=1 Tax=Streptomyces sp. NPDC005820 TaxID=3157069 RepID=UPI0033F9543C
MREMMTTAATGAGWIGTLCCATAYFLVSRRRIEPDALMTQSLNVLGAAMLALSAAVSGAWPSVTSSLVWVLIGLQTLIGVRRRPSTTEG